MTVAALRGSFTPLVTPLRGGAIDAAAYAALVERQIAGGSHGIVVNGTTAEPSTLTLDERERLLELALETADGRIAVCAATGSQSLAETLRLTRHAHRAGAHSLLVVTPYYVKPPQRGLVAYYRAVAEESDLPLLVYHIPGRTAVSVDLETLSDLRAAVPTFVGMKHAVNDLSLVTRALARFGPDFRVFVGLEDLSFPMLAIGACGLMNAVGNLDPARVARLCNAAFAGDLAAARAVHFELAELNEAVFWDTNPIPIKYMLRRIGAIAANEHRLPMVPATSDLERRLDGLLERVGLLAADAATPA